MQLTKSLFLKKSVSLITAVGLALFGGVTKPVGAQTYHHSYDQSEEFHQAQEYRRLQRARRLQVIRRTQNYKFVSMSTIALFRRADAASN